MQRDSEWIYFSAITTLPQFGYHLPFENKSDSNEALNLLFENNLMKKEFFMATS